MAENIKIIKSGVDGAIEQLQGVKENIETCNKTIIEELDKISEAWEGAAATKYVNRMRIDYTEVLSRYIGVFDSYINFLKQVHPKYEEFDTSREEVGL